MCFYFEFMSWISVPKKAYFSIVVIIMCKCMVQQTLGVLLIDGTVLVLIKLTKFAVALRLRCGSCKFIF